MQSLLFTRTFFYILDLYRIYIKSYDSIFKTVKVNKNDQDIEREI